ncbi:PREDICTED: serine/arginine repetitive matrix protein 2-like [Ceratosolen solmsi marchali]|uniref:Serine/arginine repetitive matrix protein 2-like n=1 Tax=Ceratosolen solmsi marchali TaxID=326594 RepID=A0AAJ6YUN2_9HYME|nr:PREDICTED: serine/arginine repetitive matrix protein 2-like [Ceratosolen solmsi marchali]
MSPRRTRRGTIRENITEICNDNSLKSTSKILRSTYRTNKSQTIKGSEEEIDNPVEVTSLLDNTVSFVNDTSLNSRKRKRQADTASTSQDELLNLTTEESKNKSKTKKKHVKTPHSTKKVKSDKSQIIDVNLHIVKDESSNIKTQKEKRQVSYSINNLTSKYEEIPEMVSRKKLKSDKDNSYRHKKEYKTPEKSHKALLNNVKSTEKEVTPKSSPINVSLTPHRSTKTPKKSPINLGSPKTHAHDSFKLLNVQRKLSIVDSPSSSENSNHSLKLLNSSNLENSSFENTNISHKKTTSLLLKPSSSKKKSISPVFKVRPRFSKSPKIVLRTPKSKSTKSMKTSTSKKALKKSSVSPSKSKKKTIINESLNSVKTPAESVKLKKTQKFDLEKVSKSLVKTKDLSETETSPNPESPIKTMKTTKSNSSSKSKESNKSIKSAKKESKLSPLNSSNIIFTKSKRLLNITPLSSKKMPKIILSTKKSSKSKASAKKSRKSLSPAKKSSISVSSTRKSRISVSPTKKSRISVSPTKKSRISVSPAKKSKISVSPAKRSRKSVSPEKKSRGSVSPAKSSRRSVSPAKKSRRSVSPAKRSRKSVSPAKKSRKSVSPEKKSTRSASSAKKSRRSVSPAKKSKISVSPAKRSRKSVSPEKKSTRSASSAKKSRRSVSPAKKSRGSVSPAKKSRGLVSPAKKSRISISPTKKTRRSISSVKKSRRSVSPAKQSKSISPVKRSSRSVSPAKKLLSVSPAKKSRKSVSPANKASKSVSPLKKLNKSPKIASPLKVADISANLSIKKSVNEFMNYSFLSSMCPKVVVNKLSSPVLRNSILTARRNQPTINLIPVDHVIKSSFNLDNQKVPFSDYKSLSSINDRSVLENSSLNQDSSIESLKKINSNSKTTNTLTPKQKIKRLLSLSSDKKILRQLSSSIVLNGSSTPKPKAVKRLNNQSNIKIHQPLIEDQSEPSSNETSLINMSDVFDLDGSEKDITFEINKTNLDKRKSLQDVNVFQKSSKNNTFEIIKDTSSETKVKSIKDDTYELETSQIGLEMESDKKILNEININEESESKKSCRVHFANSNLQIQANAINRIGTPGHAIQQNKISTSISKTPTRKSFINKIDHRKSVGSASKLQVKTPMNTPLNKRLSNSLSNTKSKKSIHEAQIASVNRLSRPKPIINSEKKLGTKTPVTRKIPNFADIHQKNFEKMESLIDLKKRIEKRHLTINTATSSAKKILATKYQNGSNKLAPLDSTNGIYNKFGFKLRKNDAVSMISRKQAGIVESREQKREDARNILKGVRMNRRFELQMKSRIKNS